MNRTGTRRYATSREQWLPYEGMTYAQASAAMGMHRSTAFRAARVFGLHFIDGRKVSRRADVSQKYRECAEAGLTRAQAAARLGVSYDTVARTARKYGISFRPDGVGGTRHTAADWQPLAGLTKGEAAARMGSDYRTVTAVARRYGIEFRDGRTEAHA